MTRQASPSSLRGACIHVFRAARNGEPDNRLGGQSGVDRAVLEVAVEKGIDYGGWCPQGGWAEDIIQPPGVMTVFPNLRETPSADPAQRTEWNVRDSDVTLVLVSWRAPRLRGYPAHSSFRAKARKTAFSGGSIRPAGRSERPRIVKGCSSSACSQHRGMPGERSAGHIRSGETLS